MGSSRSFTLVLAFCIAFAVVMTASAISLSSGRDALQVEELLRVEELPDDPGSPIRAHLQYAFDVFNGTQPWTQDELDERFTPGFVQGFDVEQLNEASVAAVADRGTTSYIGMLEETPDSVRAAGVAQDGTPMVVWIQTAEDGRIGSLLLEVVPSPPRLAVWESTLLLLAGWLFLAAAAATVRFGRLSEGWILLAGSAASVAGILLLSDTPALYTIGRVVPAFLVPVAAAVLLGPREVRRSRWLLVAAMLAVTPPVVAPFVRKASHIGHPEVWGSVTDTAFGYRTLLVVGWAMTGLVMLVVAATIALRAKDLTRQRRASQWAAAAVAALWAVAALGSAIDYAAGTGRWAGGLFTSLTLSALVAVPIVVALRLFNTRWDRADLASLVVDLDAQDANLGTAVANALDDPGLVKLTSPDGIALVGSDGEVVDPADLPTDRTLTEIRTSKRLVGALLHDPALRNDPERLTAVAAAAGMALEVDRLNRQVNDQLDEVNASRARIVQAGDSARRRVERDLHDGAQQRLVALGLQLQRARRLADAEHQPQLSCLVEEATSEIRHSIDEIRAVSQGAQPALLAERGLSTAVDALAERSPIPVRIDIPSGATTSDAETTAYFVIAEALTNIAKHSEATNAAVTVTSGDHRLQIRVSDDGRGGAKASRGSGLEGLTDRVAAAGGTVALASNDHGTTLEVDLPCV